MAYDPKNQLVSAKGPQSLGRVIPKSNLGVTDEESNSAHAWHFAALSSGSFSLTFPPETDSAGRLGGRSNSALPARRLPHEITVYFSEQDEQPPTRSEICRIFLIPVLLALPSALIGWYVSKHPPTTGPITGDARYMQYCDPFAWALGCLLIAALVFFLRKDFSFLNRYYRQLHESIDFSEAEDLRPISREGEPK